MGGLEHSLPLRRGAGPVLAAILAACSAPHAPSATTPRPPAGEHWRLTVDPVTAFSDAAAIPDAGLHDLLGPDEARLGALVVVQDTKDMPGADRPISGLGLVTVWEDRPPTYQEVAVPWPPLEPASDLEAACHIPGTDAEFLVAESGYYGVDSAGNPRFGRIFRLALSRSVNGWQAAVVESTRLPAGTEGVEGMACAAEGNEILVVLGERGGPTEATDGRLLWTFLASGAFPERVEFSAVPFDSNPSLGLPRDITGLHLDENGLLWVSSAVDPGDSGPFRSAVQLAGTVHMDAPAPIALLPQPVPVLYDPDRKIEGVTGGIRPGVHLSVVTEDEALGGTWYPVDLPWLAGGAR